ncbi:MAG: hypothetical protein BMS9Abin26_2137 [Gammaproteobacteria bacterium]|nr:MAG: hypothetical protein BMS9Abin26_2137 [Gammaproteobacteria bacterium]
MSTIPEFTDIELGAVQDTLKERYGHEIEVQLADSEIRLNSTDRELALCPAIYWKVDRCQFIILKTGEKAFRCQFFYSVREEYGTGIREYDDILDCVVSLLRTQSDHDAERNSSSANGTE